MAYTFTRNQAAAKHTKRFVKSQTKTHQKDGSATLEDNATNLIGGSVDAPTKFAPHDYHPVGLAQQ
jgi:hypothetical protein